MDQDAALAAVRAYCGWHVAPVQEESLTLDGPGSGTLILPSLRVNDVTSVVENGTELDPDTYEWSRSGMVRRLGWTRWTTRYRGIVITLAHGYEELPLDLQGVVDQLVTRSTAGIPAGLASRTVGPFTESYASSSDLSALTTADRSTLDRYRLPPLAGLVSSP